MKPFHMVFLCVCLLGPQRGLTARDDLDTAEHVIFRPMFTYRQQKAEIIRKRLLTSTPIPQPPPIYIGPELQQLQYNYFSDQYYVPQYHYTSIRPVPP